MQNYTDNANGDVPLIVEMYVFLISFEIKVPICSFRKKKKTDESLSLQIYIFIEVSIWTN